MLLKKNKKIESNRIAISPSSLQGANRKRFEILSESLGFVQCKSIGMLPNKGYKKTILIVDIDLNLIWKNLFFFSTVDQIYLYNLELYRISNKALISEFKWRAMRGSPFFALFKGYISNLCLVMGFKFLLSAKKVGCLITASHLRRDFLQKELCQYSPRLKVIENFPPKSLACPKFVPEVLKVMSIEDYIIIPGSYNDDESVIRLDKYCNRVNFKLLVTEIPDDKLLEKLRATIVIGNQKWEDLIGLIKYSRACACFYNDLSVNQRMSASSKIFEVINFKKLIVHNKSSGILDLIKRKNLQGAFVDIDQLAEMSSEFPVFPNDMEAFYFEDQDLCIIEQ